MEQQWALLNCPYCGARGGHVSTATTILDAYKAHYPNVTYGRSDVELIKERVRQPTSIMTRSWTLWTCLPSWFVPLLYPGCYAVFRGLGGASSWATHFLLLGGLQFGVIYWGLHLSKHPLYPIAPRRWRATLIAAAIAAAFAGLFFPHPDAMLATDGSTAMMFLLFYIHVPFAWWGAHMECRERKEQYNHSLQHLALALACRKCERLYLPPAR